MKANKQLKQASFRSVLHIISVNLLEGTGGERKRQTITAFPRISARALISNYSQKDGCLFEGKRLNEGGAY